MFESEQMWTYYECFMIAYVVWFIRHIYEREATILALQVFSLVKQVRGQRQCYAKHALKRYLKICHNSTLHLTNGVAGNAWIQIFVIFNCGFH